jgi:hypothetical protein
MSSRVQVMDRLQDLESSAPDFWELDLDTANEAFEERAAQRSLLRNTLLALGVPLWGFDGTLEADIEGRSPFDADIPVPSKFGKVVLGVAGGDTIHVYHPLAAPSVSQNLVTVDFGLKSPTRVTQSLMDLTLQRFVIEYIFRNAGSVQGGGVLYDDLSTNNLFAGRDVQKVMPGMEFPMLTFDRPTPSVALVDKWGGKFYVTDEAKDRNDVQYMTTAMRQVANTIVRKLNQYAIALVDAAITAKSRVFTGRSWSAVVTGGASQSPNTNWPARDLIHAATVAMQDEMGVEFDTVLLNPVDMENFAVVYGEDAAGVFTRNGYRNVRVSNRITAGAATFVASQQAGEYRVEKPLGTEIWREQKTERTWVQSSVRPVAYVNNAFALLRATAIT